MKKILIVSGHPDLNDSFANKTILEEVHKLLPEAEIAYLDKLYPDFQIDVQKEQERLLRADIIVLQYPLFWYTAPSLLHRWKTPCRCLSFNIAQNPAFGNRFPRKTVRNPLRKIQLFFKKKREDIEFAPLE